MDLALTRIMQVFQPGRRHGRIRLRAMMESGQFVDEVAEVIQTQAIAHKARSALRNRDACPLYHQTEEGRPPIWRENLLVETGYAPPPGMDSRYILEDSPSLWKGLKTNAVELSPESAYQRYALQILATVASLAFACLCVWFASRGAPSSSVVEASTATSPTPVVQGADNGVVESIKWAGSTTGREESSAGSGEDSGGSAPDAVPSGGRADDGPDHDEDAGESP